MALFYLLSLLLLPTGQALHMVRDSYRRPPSPSLATDAHSNAAAVASKTTLSSAAENSRDYVVDVEHDDYADMFVDSAGGRAHSADEMAVPRIRMPVIPAYHRQVMQPSPQQGHAHRLSLQSLFDAIGNGELISSSGGGGSINRMRAFPENNVNAPQPSHLMEIRVEPAPTKRQLSAAQRQRIQQQRQKQLQQQRRQQLLMNAVGDHDADHNQRQHDSDAAAEPASGHYGHSDITTSNVLADVINNNSKRASGGAASRAWQRTGGSAESASLGGGGGGGKAKVGKGLMPPPISPSIASQLMLRSSRGQRNYDVPQIGELMLFLRVQWAFSEIRWIMDRSGVGRLEYERMEFDSRHCVYGHNESIEMGPGALVGCERCVCACERVCACVRDVFTRVRKRQRQRACACVSANARGSLRTVSAAIFTDVTHNGTPSMLGMASSLFEPRQPDERDSAFKLHVFFNEIISNTIRRIVNCPQSTVGGTGNNAQLTTLPNSDTNAQYHTQLSKWDCISSHSLETCNKIYEHSHYSFDMQEDIPNKTPKCNIMFAILYV